MAANVSLCSKNRRKMGHKLTFGKDQRPFSRNTFTIGIMTDPDHRRPVASDTVYKGLKVTRTPGANHPHPTTDLTAATAS
jgi:hypothetical protein